jgi:uncharacterized damage-inducible protein DinB
MGQPVKLSDELVDDARALALQMAGGERPLSQLLSEVETTKGRKRLEATLKKRPYPPYEELLNRLRSMDEEFMAWLESVSEEELDRVVEGVPPQFELYFGTWRHMFLMRAMHWMNHRGQLADCRRAAGRPPLMI